MATVRQFRFYNLNSEENCNGGMTETSNSENSNNEEQIEVTYQTLVNGKLFGLSDANPACQIGIQALPGTRFYLNSGRPGNNAIVIGQTGIYELNTENIGINITNLQFDGASIMAIHNARNIPLIVDIIYMNDSK